MIKAEDIPLLRLSGVWRSYSTSDHDVVALQSVDLEIRAGEMIAIMGTSGSGKSTLLNILGCLDKPSEGSYQIAGQEVMTMSADALSVLRSQRFGFIFQRYQLLDYLSADENVALPAIYAAEGRRENLARARQLLDRMGLSNRYGHRPSQLSGGQQQRVGVARALINGGSIIFADEPTGALDGASSVELMRLLCELNERGHTIVVVTHDPEVAAYTRRIVHLRDGRIVSDELRRPLPATKPRSIPDGNFPRTSRSVFRGFRETIRIALESVVRKPLQTTLTLIGIAVGITAVTTVAALSEGAREKVIQDIKLLGENTITFYPGKFLGDIYKTSQRPFDASDVELLRLQSYVESASPQVSSSTLVTFGATTVSAELMGVSNEYFRVRGKTLSAGRFFSASEVANHSPVIVLDNNSKSRLFPDLENPLGQVVMVGPMPAMVVGIEAKSENLIFPSNHLVVYVPYSTLSTRLSGWSALDSIVVRVRSGVPNELALLQLEKIFTEYRGDTDFSTQSVDAILKTTEKISQQLSALALSIAGISLIVGGIGVMNMMLVTVNDRVAEIGLRVAVGARRIDILQQFLLEAIVLCLIGGLLGLVLTSAIHVGISIFASEIPMSLPAWIVVTALTSAIGVGTVFGFWPARNAANLDPATALNR